MSGQFAPFQVRLLTNLPHLDAFAVSDLTGEPGPKSFKPFSHTVFPLKCLSINQYRLQRTHSRNTEATGV